MAARGQWITQKALRRLGQACLAGFLITVIFALGLMALLAWLFSGARPVLFAEVQTNHVSFTADRSQLAVLPLRNAILLSPESVCGETGAPAAASSGQAGDTATLRRLTARVTPPTGATIEYFALPDYLQINIRPKAAGDRILVESQQANCQLQERLTVLLESGALRQNQPLPVFGRLEVSQETGIPERPDPGGLQAVTPALVVERLPRYFIHGGSAQIFGRSAWPWARGRLYPVAESSFPILRGSRIVVAAEEVSGSVMRQPGAAAMDLQFTVSAEELRLFRPGSRTQSEVIAVGPIARAFGDPTIAPFLVAFLLASFFLQLGFGFFTLFTDLRKGET